ncbi:hypothetical protein FRB99_004288, partial [Tulasnella sp. 403]
MVSTVVSVLLSAFLASRVLAAPVDAVPAASLHRAPSNATRPLKNSEKSDFELYPKRTVYPVSTLSTSQVSSYKPYTHLAAAAYCPLSALNSWTCGSHCSALPGFITYASGGNNQDIPDWYVGYLPSLSSAVVVHQGTTVSEIESDFIDIDFFFTTLSSTNFPGVSSDVMVHNGFATAQGKTASA